MADDATPPSGVWLRRRARKYVGRLLRYMRDGFRYATFPLRYSDSRGVFDSFEQAKAAAPRGKPIGYDDSELANEYADSLDLRLADYDYPFLFHLDKMLNDVGRRCSILDFGGNVGLHYLKYRQHLDLENVTWTVCEALFREPVGSAETAGGV